MRILQIAPPWIDTPPPGYGGTELVVHLLTEELVRLGHDVTLFATGNSRTRARLAYTHERSLNSQNIPWDAALPALLHYDRALALTERKQFDIIHAHPSSQTDLALLPLLAKSKVPTLLTLHSPFPLDMVTKMDEMYLHYYGYNFSAVNISRSMRGITPRAFKSAGVVYNSVPLDRFTFQPKPGSYLAWLGKIYPHKGLAEAIQVAKMLNRKLVFAGIVEQFSPASVEYFEKTIKPQIDGKQIVFLGEADMKLKNELLSNAEAFLSPISWEEPFGLVMVEAQACGTPVVAFNRGAAPEVIADGVSGYVVSTVEEMANKVAGISAISRRDCRTFVEEKFSPQVMAQGYLAAYRKVMDNSTVWSPKDFAKDRLRFFASTQM